MDYFIIVVTTVAGLYFHWWLYVRIKRWMDRDLALALAGKDEQKKAFMLEQLASAQAQKIKADVHLELASFADEAGFAPYLEASDCRDATCRRARAIQRDIRSLAMR